MRVFNAKWAIFQLFHDENELHFDDNDVRFALNKHAYSKFSSH